MTSRGKNFTEREKCKLLELVQKFKHIIENKCTNAVYTVQKNQAWEAITAEFNSNAETPRTQKQLITVYLNLKRITRKNVASVNVKRYLERKEDVAGQSQISNRESEISQIDEQSIETGELRSIIKQFKKDEMADKKGVRGTGGGSYTPVLSDIGAQMLAVMGNQVTPLINSFDSASSYYITEKDPMILSASATLNIQPPDEVIVNDCPPIPSNTTISSKPPKRKRVLKNKENNEILKRKYYLKSLESANVEKRTKIVEYKNALLKQKLLNLEIKIKQKVYENCTSK